MRYINIFLIGFICLWLNRSASTHDKLAVKRGLNNLFNEPSTNNFVNLDELPVYYTIANTNITGWLLVIDERQLENLKVNPDNITISKLNIWKQNNMDNPNHLKWDKGESWEDVVATNGLRIIPQ